MGYWSRSEVKDLIAHMGRNSPSAVSAELIEAAKEVLHQLTRNRTHDVQGDWTIADGYGLDDEVAALSEAIEAAEKGAD